MHKSRQIEFINACMHGLLLNKRCIDTVILPRELRGGENCITTQTLSTTAGQDWPPTCRRQE